MKLNTLCCCTSLESVAGLCLPCLGHQVGMLATVARVLGVLLSLIRNLTTDRNRSTSQRLAWSIVHILCCAELTTWHVGWDCLVVDAAMRKLIFVCWVTLLHVFSWLKAWGTHLRTTHYKGLLNDGSRATSLYFSADLARNLLSCGVVAVLLGGGACVRSTFQPWQVVWAWWRFHGLVAADDGTLLLRYDLLLLLNISYKSVSFTIFCDTAHHLYKNFLSILQPLEQWRIRNLELWLFTALKGTCLDLFLRVDESHNAWAACEHKFTLIWEDDLNHFVTVTQKDGLFSFLPLFDVC